MPRHQGEARSDPVTDEDRVAALAMTKISNFQLEYPAHSLPSGEG